MHLPPPSLLARHFIEAYPENVTKCQVVVEEDVWKRAYALDEDGREKEHQHAFLKTGPQSMFARCEAAYQRIGGVSFRLYGGIRNLTMLKTTQSSFTSFHKDIYTSLPEVQDR